MADPSEWSLDDLRAHLQAGVELELLLIPPYLCALFSLEQGSNREAALIIRSVVIEEMLHLTLAANVLNAVGGKPVLTDRKWVGHYPTQLPFHTPLAVDIRPFDDTALSTFLAVEHPGYPIGSASPPPAAPTGAATPRLLSLGDSGGEEYPTIGAFYTAIQEGLRHLVDKLGVDEVFIGHEDRQVGPEQYYASGGELRVVRGPDDAHAALEEIIEQGEGELTLPPPGEKFDPDRDLAHFYRFNELRMGRRYQVGDEPDTPTGDEIDVDFDAVYRMQPNLRLSDLPANGTREAAVACNDIWFALLLELEAAFDGEPRRVERAVSLMWALKDAMVGLMRLRLPNGLQAGPTFELPPA